VEPLESSESRCRLEKNVAEYSLSSVTNNYKTLDKVVHTAHKWIRLTVMGVLRVFIWGGEGCVASGLALSTENSSVRTYVVYLPISVLACIHVI